MCTCFKTKPPVCGGDVPRGQGICELSPLLRVSAGRAAAELASLEVVALRSDEMFQRPGKERPAPSEPLHSLALALTGCVLACPPVVANSLGCQFQRGAELASVAAAAAAAAASLVFIKITVISSACFASPVSSDVSGGETRTGSSDYTSPCPLIFYQPPLFQMLKSTFHKGLK